MIPYLLKTNSVSLFPANQPPIIIDETHINFVAVVNAIKERDFDNAVALASVKSYLNSISGGAVSVNDDGVTYQGNPLTGYLANKLHQFFQEGLPVEHYCKFVDNLMANPSMTSRKELYLFLEAADLPITEDGCFIAYKAVNASFRDKHTGNFDNSPGTVLSMLRRNVDDNRDVTCSYGFHAAAYEYAKGFMSHGDKLVAVKINPADVVSVPSDYKNQKLRCCKYEVLFEIPDASDIFKGRAMYNADLAQDIQDYVDDDTL
jgi:hypothetical protein